MTALFSSSRKQNKSFTFQHHCHYHQPLQSLGSTNHMVVTPLVKHTIPPPSSLNILDLLNPPPYVPRDIIYEQPPLETFIFWSGPLNLKTGKKREETTNIEYLKNKKCYLEEIKTIFHNFLNAFF